MREEISHGITLQWKMSEACGAHWARGLGQHTVNLDVDDVIANGLQDIEENSHKGKNIVESARNLADKNIPWTTKPTPAEETLPHEISVTVTSRLWHAGMNKVSAPDRDVRSTDLLAAIILADKSWIGAGNDEQWRQRDAGWHQNDLVASLSSLSTRRMPREISLRHREIRLLEWAMRGAVGAAIGTGILAIVAVLEALSP